MVPPFSVVYTPSETLLEKLDFLLESSCHLEIDSFLVKVGSLCLLSPLALGPIWLELDQVL